MFLLEAGRASVDVIGGPFVEQRLMAPRQDTLDKISAKTLAIAARFLESIKQLQGK